MVVRVWHVGVLVLAVASIAAWMVLSSGGGSKPSHAAFVARANAICVAGNRRLNAIHNDSTAALAGMDDMIGKLNALTPPARDAAAFASLLASLHELRAGDSSLFVAMKSGDTAKARVLAAQYEPMFKRGRTTALKLGLTSCLIN
jgi:hypothetical protein